LTGKASIRSSGIFRRSRRVPLPQPAALTNPRKRRLQPLHPGRPRRQRLEPSLTSRRRGGRFPGWKHGL